MVYLYCINNLGIYKVTKGDKIMAKKLRKVLSVFLVALMLLTSAPLQGFVGVDLPEWFSSKAQAAGVSGYNAIAAAEWAKSHVYDTWSCLYGQGYWEPGTGDCANFVSQCIYMGGIDQTSGWNHSGYKAHYSTSSDGSWIRASQLHDYVVSIGGVDIQNPSASQIEVGDLIFYKQNPGTSGFSHCAIVIDVSGGTVTVAAHTTNEICYTDTNWHLGFSNEGTHLVKMYGATCTERVVRDFDVYTAGSDSNVYSEPSTSSTRRFYFYPGEYAHVYETKTVNGVTWGYTCGYGANFYYGWVKLSTLNYKCHVSTGPVAHIMGDWYVKVQPTCTTVGVEERVCSRCGYTEQRNMSLGGTHKNVVPATCLSPSYCTACGTTISTALGHDWSNWVYNPTSTCIEKGFSYRICNRCTLVENNELDLSDHTWGEWSTKDNATCISSGLEYRVCLICSIEQTKTIDSYGHDYQIEDSRISTCTEEGYNIYTCTRCNDSYTEEVESLGHKTKYEYGDIVEFGQYPQTQVLDADLILELNNSISDDNWQFYDYYGDGDGSYGSMKKTESMKYLDLEYYGEKYRAVVINSYRPASTYGTAKGRQEQYGFQLNEIYWFKFEPLKWKILDYENGLLFCDNVIDSQPFSETIYYLSPEYSMDENFTAYANNYEYSTIRAWLNSSFYSSAFTENEKNYIRVKEIDNSPYWPEESLFRVNNTQDDVFLLSYNEMLNTDYGFISDNSNSDSRVTTTTDYAKSQGINGPAVGDINPSYWLRTAGMRSDWSCYVGNGAVANSYSTVALTYHGVRPAIYVDFSDDIFQSATVPINPTCIEHGLTSEEHCLRCKAILKRGEEIPPLGHDWIIDDELNATCLTDGYLSHTCKRCGISETITTKALGHDPVVTLTENRATCSNIGNTQQVECTRCDVILEESKEISVLGHKADEQWVVTKAPTCTEAGEEMCKCVRHDDGVTCDKTYTRVIEAVGHSLVKTDAVAVTCEKDGNREYYQCENCIVYFANAEASEEITENSWIITATGHNGKNTDGSELWMTELEAACGTTGRECLYCQNEWCDYTVECENHTSHNYLIDEREIAEITPDYAVVEHKDPTCIDLGYDVWSCLNCFGTENEHGWTDIINYIPHNWCEPIVVHATCTEGGTETIICDYCKREETYGTSNAIGHALSPLDEEYENSDDKMELISSVSNVCGDGSVDTYQCTHIDENTSLRCTYTVTVGNENDHSLGDYVISLEPTCTEEGYKHKECENEGCEYRTDDVVIAPIGHNWELKETVVPTCETQGYDHYICKSDSNHEYSDYNKSMLGHTPDNNWVVINEPTCAEKGEEQCKCIRYDDGDTCIKVYTREIEINPDAHNWDNGTINPESTCDTHGIKTYTCQNDSSHTYTETVDLDPENHVGETYIKDEKDATCTEDGYTGDTYCSDCDKLLEEGAVIPATNHDWDEWKTVTPATCEEDGLEKRICKNDSSHIEENVLPAINHKWDDGIIDPESTCKTHGTKTYTCQNDSSHTYTETVDLDPENHAGETYLKDEKAPTCTEDGYTGNIYCSDCNALLTKGEVIPATDHDWGKWETVTSATCETDGLEKRVCKNDASHTEENILPAINHKWNDGVIDPESTCKTHGTKTYTCQNDSSHTYTEEVPLDENNHVGETYIKDAKTENCIEDGYTGDEHCSDCDALLESGKIIDKLGHNMSKWDSNNNATHTRECQRDNGCKYTETVNCTFGDWVVTKEATCTTKGSKERICTVCGYKETAEITLKAHTPGEAVIENRVEPKCEEKGSYDEVVYCTECPEELNRVKKDIEPIDHDWGEWKTSKDATIDAKGEEKRICKRDSSHIETRETDKLIAYTAYFIKANNNGSFEYDGKKYDLVDTVKFAKGTTVIVNPDVPQVDGFIGYWENYTLEDKDIYIEAVYELKSSNNQSDLKSDKDVVYKDGVATIVLSAFAETLNAKVPMGATPYDIILVMDQSSSMTSYKIGKETRLAVLERVAKEFVTTVYESAVENNVDHRVALVSFSGTKDNYKGTGIIGANGTIKTFNKLTDADYASAFVDVKDNLSTLKNGIDSLTGIQGTSSDYGLQIAKQILANNQDGREKLVLFITDGEPGDPGRNMGAFNYTVANEAIEYANQIKNLYGTTIYSIGVAAGADPSDETDKINKFLHYVSSNYPEAKDMDNKGTAATLKNYFLSAEDSDEIAEMFESIVSRQIVNTISFTKVNFYDTVSEYFTLTTENENALRETVKAEYGVSDDDIIITRNDDGTTTVRINNLIPKAIFDDNNVQIGYGVTVKFDVTANEKTLEGGTFKTNTEDAGVENDGKTVIEFKVPNGESISSGRAIVEFRIGDEVYAIREVSIGDKVVVPETDVADWVVTDGTTVTSDYTVFNTEYTSETRTVRWIIDGNVKEEVYHIGEIIFAPEFAVPDGKLFKGWNLKVPYRMPDYDLEFTAVFESHEHNYKETAKNGECTTGIVVTYTCDCGSSYNEAKKYDAHNYTANVQLVNNESVATMSCTVCGKAESKVINYKAQYDTNSWWNKTKVVDLTLYDNAGIAVQPDEYIYIKVYSEGDVLSNAKNGKLIIKRVNENDTEDNIPYLNNSSTDSCGYYVDGNYIVLKLDHFSYYALVMPEDAANVPSYGQIECAFNGHSYTSKVVAPTCTVNGYTTYICTTCGDTYNDAETVALGHSMGAYVVTKQPTCTDNGIETSTCSRCDKTETKSVAAKGHNYKDGVCTGCDNNKVQNCTHMCHKSGFMGFIWKIVRFFWKLFKMNPVCECGVAHY